MSTDPHSGLRLYNPDWLSDDELVAGFTARLEMLKFLCGELERVPIRGTTHHYLLVGVRGSGKTSMLKRIAVAIRREERLSGHLIGLSFPEELYEVKGLGDFWWASCRALVDALDSRQFGKIADDLAKKVEEQGERGPSRDPHDDAGLRLMLDVCNKIERRPVLLVDNLDLVLKRIDKSGRKLKDRQSPAYWALREILSTATAPIVVGGSVRLSTPFLGHDDAFYDYFVAQRLIKLSLEEVRSVFDHLARHYGDENLGERIRKRPGRLRALYEMTGGNPRALGLVFELLRRGPNSSAVDAFEQLLDLTTPYYKARFEELPEQAQVVLHALALSRRDITKASYGHRAAVVAQRAGLDTRVVSAQLEMMISEGVVEKNKALGERTQYRVAEQLFRLWLQMRSTRRMRQQVISLTEFLEALFDRDEHQELIRREEEDSQFSSFHSRAKLNLALSELQREKNLRYVLETRAVDAMLEAGAFDSSQIEGIFAPGDLSEGIEFEARRNLQKCTTWHKTFRPDAARLTRDLLGSLRISRNDKRATIEKLCDRQLAAAEFERIAPLLEEERRQLQESLSEAETDLLYAERASGRLALPNVQPEDVELATGAVTSLVWTLLEARIITPASNIAASAWISWGKKNFAQAGPARWAAIAAAMRIQDFFDAARDALDIAFGSGSCADAWYELGSLNLKQKNWTDAELAFRTAIEIDPTDSLSWYYLGDALDCQNRYEEAESAFRHATQLDPDDDFFWSILGSSCHRLNRYNEAEAAYRKALDIDPKRSVHWRGLGNLLHVLSRFEEAESAYLKAIEHEPSFDLNWIVLGVLYQTSSRFAEAEAAYRKALGIKPSVLGWHGLGNTLKTQRRYDEAQVAYENAIECDPEFGLAWMGLGDLFGFTSRLDQAESAFRRATEVDPDFHLSWVSYGKLLIHTKRYDEAEHSYRKAIELAPENAPAWHGLGSALQNQERLEDAERAYRTAIELDSSSVQSLVGLSMTVMSEPERIDEAIELLFRAQKLSPENRYVSVLLELAQNQKKLDGAFTAYREGNWVQMGKEFSAMAFTIAESASLLADPVFIRDIVRDSLRCGNGAKLLATFHEARLETIALPLVLALDAAIEGGEEKLGSVEPEVRAAAQLLFKQLTDDSD